MRLVLAVEDKILASVPVDKEKARNRDYIDAKRRLLLAKHRLSIAAPKGEPVFYLQVQSKANSG